DRDNRMAVEQLAEYITQAELGGTRGPVAVDPISPPYRAPTFAPRQVTNQHRTIDALDSAAIDVILDAAPNLPVLEPVVEPDQLPLLVLAVVNRDEQLHIGRAVGVGLGHFGTGTDIAGPPRGGPRHKPPGCARLGRQPHHDRSRRVGGMDNTCIA